VHEAGDFEGAEYVASLVKARLSDLQRRGRRTSWPEPEPARKTQIDVPEPVIAAIRGEVRGAVQALIAARSLRPSEARPVLAEFEARLREVCIVDEIDFSFDNEDPPPEPT